MEEKKKKENKQLAGTLIACLREMKCTKCNRATTKSTQKRSFLFNIAK